MSKEDQEEAYQAKLGQVEDARLAKSEEALKDDIASDEKHKADLDEAHRDGSSEEMQPTIKKAEDDLKKMEKKEDKKTKKAKADNTKEQLDEAKATDKKLKEDMKAAQPPPLAGPASLVQKSKVNMKAKLFDSALKKNGFDKKAKLAAPVLKKLSVAEITKMVIEKAKKQKLAQAEPEMSKEDQEEADQAKLG